jgi:hypothetical protein
MIRGIVLIPHIPSWRSPIVKKLEEDLVDVACAETISVPDHTDIIVLVRRLRPKLVVVGEVDLLQACAIRSAMTVGGVQEVMCGSPWKKSDALVAIGQHICPTSETAAQTYIEPQQARYRDFRVG